MSIRVCIDQLSFSEKKELQTILTFTFRNPFGADQTINAWLSSNNDLFIPYQFGIKYFKIKQDFEIKKSLDSWKFIGILYDEQKQLKEKALPILQKTGSIALFLPCAWGKTVQAIDLISSIIGENGGIGLIVINRKILIKQWQDTIKDFTNITNQVSVLMVSEVNNNKVDALILDEAHLLCTQSSIDKILTISAKFIIILTATPERDDHFDKFLSAIAGGSKHQFWALSKKPFKVFPLLTGFGAKNCPKQEVSDLTRISLESALSKLEQRNIEIVKLISRLVKFTEFKICLALGRIEQIENIYTLLSDLEIDVSMLYGNIKQIRNSRVLIVCLQKAGVGFDDKSNIIDWDSKRIDLLIMGISTYKIVQPLGRVQRAKNPFIIQLIDDHKWFINSWKDNVKEYEIRNGKVFEMNDWKNTLFSVIEEINKPY